MRHEDVLTAVVVERFPGESAIERFEQPGDVEEAQPFAKRPWGERDARAADSARDRELPEGSVAHFSPGPGGAHAVMNLSEEPMRYVMIAAHATPDILEYPDKGEFAAVANSRSQRGKPFFVRSALPET
jgi:hypothetical protein